MRILAIETVGTTGSVAVLQKESLVAEQRLDPRSRSAQSLVPTIRDLLAQVGWSAGDMELVCVARGPGSFTGLRIGVTSAKVFAYAVGCQLIGVHALLSIASQAPPGVSQVTVVLDAGRNEFFAGDFQRSSDDGWKEVGTTRLVGHENWLAQLRAGQVVTGSGLELMEQRLPPGVTPLERAVRTPSAAGIGRVGWRMFLEGRRDDPFSLVPEYFRRTAAEEQWDSKR